jgi:hypothetical protein
MYKSIVQISAGSANASETWTATVKDESGTNVTGQVALTSGFANLAGGHYTWVFDQFADAFYGSVRFVSSPAGIVRVAAISPPPPTPETAGTGTGDIAVNHNYGGTDARRVLESDGTTPVDAAIIRAYLTSEYNAGNIDPNPPVTVTGANGRWLAPLMLDAGAYTLTVWNPVSKRSKPFTVTVA